MEHQSERHADRLFARYRRWIVTRQQERTGLFVEGNVLLHGWWQSGLFANAGVESMEAGRAFCRFQSEQTPRRNAPLMEKHGETCRRLPRT